MGPSPATIEPRVIRGTAPKPTEKEFIEMMHYDSGDADRDAALVKGRHEEPWVNVIEAFEPSSLPGFERMLAIPELRSRIAGRVLDVGAGTCWLSAKLSRLPEVDEVLALDLSERFLRTTGTRVLRTFDADLNKVTFVASDFNQIPLDEGSVDCAFLWAALHHSLSPIKTVKEVGRCLKKGGTLIVFEMPTTLVNIRKRRQMMLGLSEKATELTYTMDEWRYIFDNARLGPVTQYPSDEFKATPKGVVRQVMRKLHIEHLLMPHMPPYFFRFTKE
jgi:ubiquinone/menaquinone biosynthesis C-methylase UbiE